MYFMYTGSVCNESYDASIDCSLIDCAKACKINSGCRGFGYNMKDKSCYLSKEAINSKVLTQLYSHKYKSENVRCNKILDYSHDGEVKESDRKNNSLFSCENHPFNMNKSLWYQNNNKFTEVKDIDKLNELDAPEEYKIYIIDWPRSGFESDVFNAKIGLINGKKDVEFTQVGNMSYGGYLHPYQCVKDVSITDCKAACLAQLTCRGIEYNLNFKDHSNVCCLKSDVDNIDDRHDIYKNGILYIKNNKSS